MEMLREHGLRHRHPVNVATVDGASFGERLADRIASGIGSWRFLIIQTVAVLCWVALNLVAAVSHWDAYPFILLNLLFSVQAAYTGPVLLLAGNRQSKKDRLTAEHDFEIDCRSEATVQRVLEELERNSIATLRIAEKIGAELETHIEWSRQLQDAIQQRSVTATPGDNAGAAATPPG